MADFFVKLINYLIAGVGAALTWALALFPQTPFQEPVKPPDIIDLGYITWLLDFPTWLKHLSLLLIAIGGWYTIRVVARWIKLARD